MLLVSLCFICDTFFTSLQSLLKLSCQQQKSSDSKNKMVSRGIIFRICLNLKKKITLVTKNKISGCKNFLQLSHICLMVPIIKDKAMMMKYGNYVGPTDDSYLETSVFSRGPKCKKNLAVITLDQVIRFMRSTIR